jgi:hypothetical protein
MPTFYFDTSALFKRYQEEAGTAVVDYIFKLLENPENKASISFLTLLEVTASARRLLKGKVLDDTWYADRCYNVRFCPKHSSIQRNKLLNIKSLKSEKSCQNMRLKSG